MFASFIGNEELNKIVSENDTLFGRILSKNYGKNYAVGVMALHESFTFYSCGVADCSFDKGDIVYFHAGLLMKNSRLYLQIQNVIKCIKCSGSVPNGQARSEKDNSIVKAIFDPELFSKQLLFSMSLREIRSLLYKYGFHEVQTPSLFDKKSSNNANPFVSKSVNEKMLYLRTIQENLLKPYIMIGFNRVFEIGHVFRNILYSANYDCEFCNLDVFSSRDSYNRIIDLCEEITLSVCKVFGIVEVKKRRCKYLDVLNCAIEKGLTLKQYVSCFCQNELLMILDYPNKDIRVRRYADSEYGMEFHVFLYGFSYAHGYMLAPPLKEISNETTNYIERYSDFGMYDIVGFGIGLDKLFQACTGEIEMINNNMYRRDY